MIGLVNIDILDDVSSYQLPAGAVGQVAVVEAVGDFVGRARGVGARHQFERVVVVFALVALALQGEFEDVVADLRLLTVEP